MQIELKTIEQEWEGFRQATIPNVNAVQANEMKKAFFAGAMTMFGMVMQCADLGEDQADERLSELDHEIKQYLKVNIFLDHEELEASN